MDRISADRHSFLHDNIRIILITTTISNVLKEPRKEHKSLLHKPVRTTTPLNIRRSPFTLTKRILSLIGHLNDYDFDYNTINYISYFSSLFKRILEMEEVGFKLLNSN